MGELLGERYAESGNCGLLDVVQALRWIRENIAAFGGDPDRVTVMGHSAGAKLLGGMLVTPQAEGLFHRAILQSGAAQSVRSRETAATIARELLDRLGLQPDQAADLLRLPAGELIRAQAQLFDGRNVLHAFGPVIDGIAIPRPPFDTLAAGQAARVPVLIGTCKNESIFYANAENPWSPAMLASLFGHQAEAVRRACERELAEAEAGAAEGDANAQAMQAAGIDASTPPQWTGQAVRSVHAAAREGAVLTSYLYGFASYRLAGALAEQDSPVYRYRFDYDREDALATHGAEMAHIWKTDEKRQENEPAVRELSRVMNTTWVEFIRSGIPAAEGLPSWPPYQPAGKGELLVFDLECRVESEASPRIEPGFDHPVLILD